MQNLLTSVPPLEYFSRFPQVKAIFFDLDGTLIDSERYHAQCFIQMFKLKFDELSKETVDKIIIHCLGQTDQYVFKYLMNHKIIPSESIEKLQLIKNQIFQRMIGEKIKLTNDIKILLAALKNRYKLAIVTSSERESAQYIWQTLNLSDYFEFFIAREDTSKNKPDPEPYKYAMKLMQVSAEDALIFEDSEVGYQAALASEAEVIRVAWF